MHPDRPLDRSLMTLALALFVCGVLVDRARLDLARAAGVLRRRRR
jgi:hypothetical protein